MNLAEEIADAHSARDEKMSQLVVVKTERAKLMSQIAQHLPTHVFKTKRARIAVLGAEQQALDMEIGLINRRLRHLKWNSKDERPESNGVLRDRQADLGKWFMQVAHDVLEPALFQQICDAALMRAQIQPERKSQPGDGRSIANAQWVR